MDGGDGCSGHVILQTGVEGDDLGIVPRRDRAVVDIHQGLASRMSLGRVMAVLPASGVGTGLKARL